MKQEESSELTEQASLEEAKKKKSDAIMNAFFIGFLVGIVIYSVAKNTFGFLTLIPLFLIYKLIKGNKKKSEQIDE